MKLSDCSLSFFFIEKLALFESFPQSSSSSATTAIPWFLLYFAIGIADEESPPKRELLDGLFATYYGKKPELVLDCLEIAVSDDS